MIRAAILSEVFHAIVVFIVVYIMVAGDEIEGGNSPYPCQFPQYKAISVALVLGDNIASDDYKGIPIPRYLLHDGFEHPPPFMEIGNNGELKGVRGGFTALYRWGRGLRQRRVLLSPWTDSEKQEKNRC